MRCVVCRCLSPAPLLHLLWPAILPLRISILAEASLACFSSDGTTQVLNQDMRAVANVRSPPCCLSERAAYHLTPPGAAVSISKGAMVAVHERYAKKVCAEEGRMLSRHKTRNWRKGARFSQARTHAKVTRSTVFPPGGQVRRPAPNPEFPPLLHPMHTCYASISHTRGSSRIRSILCCWPAPEYPRCSYWWRRHWNARGWSSRIRWRWRMVCTQSVECMCVCVCAVKRHCHCDLYSRRAVRASKQRCRCN